MIFFPTVPMARLEETRMGRGYSQLGKQLMPIVRPATKSGDCSQPGRYGGRYLGVKTWWAGVGMDLTASFQQLAKIDYLDGLGIGIGPRELSLVHMTKRFLQISVRQVRTVPLPESGQGRLDACGQALKEFSQ